MPACARPSGQPRKPVTAHRRRHVHILLFEMSLSGHHANYLDHIAQLFLSQGHRVTVSVREPELGHPVLATLRERYPERCRAEPLPAVDRIDRGLSRLGVAGGELSAWRAFRRFYRRLHRQDPVDRVFYPYLDYCLHATALLGAPSGPAPWAGICMRPSFHLRRSGVIAPVPAFAAAKERLFGRLLRTPGLLTLFTLDELLEQHLQQTQRHLSPRLKHLPDPAELANHHTRATARAQLGIDPDRFVILVYGAIDDRKGVDHLLAGLRSRHMPRPVLVVTAGKHTAAVRAVVSDAPDVRSIDRYIDHETEEALFRAADLVWMGYRHHFAMSGVLVLAAMAGVPVLATHLGLIGWMTRQHALGSMIDTTDPKQVAQVLHHLIAQPTPVPTEGMQRIRQRHRWGLAEQLIQTAMHQAPSDSHVEAI